METVSLQDMPIEYIYLLIEVVVSTGVREVIYPFSMTCKKFNELINKNLNNIINKYTILVEELECDNSTGIKIMIPCLKKKFHHELAGVNHGPFKTEVKYDQHKFVIGEMTGNFRFGKLHGITTYHTYYGRFDYDYEQWNYGVKYGAYFHDSGKDGLVERRVICMTSNDKKSHLSFDVCIYGNRRIINPGIDISSADDYVTLFDTVIELMGGIDRSKLFYTSKDEAYPCDLFELTDDEYPAELPLLDDYQSWHNLYFELRDIFLSERPELIKLADRLDA
jgi:hypothetical protein